jgi:OOP family OmpA-OmpF porin
MIRAGLALIFLSAAPSFAQAVSDTTTALAGLPEKAVVSASAPKENARIALPKAAWRAEGIETLPVEGEVTRTAWRIPQNRVSPLDLLAPIRATLLDEGYTPLYECAAAECGGFDFRYALPLLPEPEMHVDLADYQYFLGQKGDEITALITSRSSESGFIQVIQVGRATQSREPAAGEPILAPAATRPPSNETQGDIAQSLDAQGHAALDDLVFSTGAASLEPQDYASLEALAAYLKRNPETRAALVGHTDTDGALALNTALSKRRAQAVRERLIERWDVPAAQITAEGAGWLAPRASNATPEGREKNRRVEVIITSTRS